MATVLSATDLSPAATLGLEQKAEVVSRYFALFNQGEYRQVADLFMAEGTLYPPFESPVVGKDNISNYLVDEADGMTVSLLSAETQSLEANQLQVDVRGSVTALVFKVNVTWRFAVAATGKINSVRVDLVATLEELLKLRPDKAA